jgi:Rrf2 family protein
MKISTKGRYALRMLVDMAQQEEGKPIPLKEISKRQNISKKYLEQIVPVLHGAGLLRTVRGHQGGYLLAKSPQDITVYDIILATEGSLAPVACLDDTPNLCPRAQDCKTLPVWQGLHRVVKEYLSSITVAEVAHQPGDTMDFCI